MNGAWSAILAGTALFALPLAAEERAAGRIAEGSLDAFAAASLEVEELAETWRSRIGAEPSAAGRARLRETALAEMAEAAAAAGLTVTAYNRIVAAARDDPGLVERIMERRAELE